MASPSSRKIGDSLLAVARGQPHRSGGWRPGRGERVDAASYYFRTFPRFETAHPKYAFLNRLVAIATGDRRPEGPIYTIDEIL